MGGLDDDRRAMVSVLAHAIHARLRPSYVVVDTSSLDRHRDRMSMLLDELRRLGSSSEEDDDARKEEEEEEEENDADGDGIVATTVLEMTDDGLLIPLDMVPKVLGRSMRGGRTLRWSTFLGNALAIASETDEAGAAAATGAGRSARGIVPVALPPPLRGMNELGSHFTAEMPSDEDSLPRWAMRLLSGWGEISENDAPAMSKGGSEAPSSERRRRAETTPWRHCRGVVALLSVVKGGGLFFSTRRCLSFLSSRYSPKTTTTLSLGLHDFTTHYRPHLAGAPSSSRSSSSHPAFLMRSRGTGQRCWWP